MWSGPWERAEVRDCTVLQWASVFWGGMDLFITFCPSAGTETWEWWWPTSCSACGRTSVRFSLHISTYVLLHTSTHKVCELKSLKCLFCSEFWNLNFIPRASNPLSSSYNTFAHIHLIIFWLMSCLLVVGENKIHFIPGMIGPFLGVTLVPQVEVRNIMIPIFHDMMDWEQRKNGNFKQVTQTDASITWSALDCSSLKNSSGHFWKRRTD